MEKSEHHPLFPFTKLKFVSYGPRIHRPSVWPWLWEATIPYYNFWFQTEGAGRLVCRGKEYRLEPGTCFLFTPGTKVWATNDEGAGMANFAAHFFPVTEQRISHRRLEPLFGRKVVRMNYFLELSADIMAAHRQGDRLGRQQSEWALLTMISHLWREAFHSPQAAQNEKIIEVLNQVAYSAERPSGIPDLARQAGLSSSQFTRRIREITGDSPNDYIIHERIRHACFLLMETSKSVKMVAADLGYADTSFFVRQFRKIMSVTPSQYRNAERRAVVETGSGEGNRNS